MWKTKISGMKREQTQTRDKTSQLQQWDIWKSSPSQLSGAVLLLWQQGAAEAQHLCRRQLISHPEYPFSCSQPWPSVRAYCVRTVLNSAGKTGVSRTHLLSTTLFSDKTHFCRLQTAFVWIIGGSMSLSECFSTELVMVRWVECLLHQVRCDNLWLSQVWALTCSWLVSRLLFLLSHLPNIFIQWLGIPEFDSRKKNPSLEKLLFQADPMRVKLMWNNICLLARLKLLLSDYVIVEGKKWVITVTSVLPHGLWCSGERVAALETLLTCSGGSPSKAEQDFAEPNLWKPSHEHLLIAPA